MIMLRRYRASDYLNIHRRKFDLYTFLNFPDPERVAKELSRGPALSLVCDTGIIACGGILPLWRRVGEAWMVTSSMVEKHPLLVIRKLLKAFLEIIENYRFERVQTTIDVENEKSIKLAEWLGFKNEGLMKKYIGGRDFYRYAWIKEG